MIDSWMLSKLEPLNSSPEFISSCQQYKSLAKPQRSQRMNENKIAIIIVERLVIIELKSVEKIAEVHKKQLLTYLRLADMRLGLLVIFGAPLIKDGITRIVNGLKD
jgi:GxxExxY protein